MVHDTDAATMQLARYFESRTKSPIRVFCNMIGLQSTEALDKALREAISPDAS